MGQVAKVAAALSLTASMAVLAHLIGSQQVAEQLVDQTAKTEGLRTSPYVDGVSAGHPNTVCYGATGVEMRTYTPDECKAMLANTLAVDARQLQARMGDGAWSAMSPGARGALTDYTYQRGIGNVARLSGPNDPPSIYAVYKAGDAGSACRLYSAWAVVKTSRGSWADCNVKSNNCRGVATRREWERQMCIAGSNSIQGEKV